MQSMEKAADFEKKREAELEQRRQQLLDEKKAQKRLTASKARQMDQRILDMEQELKGRLNPYLSDAEQALNLKVSDFSVQDKKMAEKLLQ